LREMINQRIDFLVRLRKRKRELFHQNTMTKVFGEGRGTDYLAALRDGRMHDAAQIERGKTQQSLVFDKQHEGGCYRFFSQKPSDMALKGPDTGRFVVSKSLY
jgi:hypothetical protein